MTLPANGTEYRPCRYCHTAVLIYPPEDGADPLVTCGRCAGEPHAVISKLRRGVYGPVSELSERKPA
ncbi:hypothetical protein ACFS2C_11815 [Prauserella oleivorans]|uniref:Uncharacterized protein n=1 Tax=Prauserella oleivorans TaxID=1478153 RepID=A0ABW5WBW9_9PSEU